MRYISTRGQSPPVSFLDAVLAGMAPDGGLYVPESWPAHIFAASRIEPAIDTYAEVARVVLSAFAGDDLSAEEGHRLAEEEYWSATIVSGGGGRRWRPDVTQLI